MIQIPDRALPPETASKLSEFQQEIDAIAGYKEKVAEGKSKFTSRNKAENSVFRVVREVLRRMSPGNERCVYCENSDLDQVEHIKPKDLYPEVVFAWENYLYACGPCNRIKRNQYAIFVKVTGELVDITRPFGAPVVEPHMGEDVFINLRFEDPFEFLWLDLSGTFLFIPKPDISERNQQRAQYTIDTVALNRDALPESRESFYNFYLLVLDNYIEMKNNMQPVEPLLEIFKQIDHPTVWREMKRQKNGISKLKTLFELAPEALDW